VPRISPYRERRRHQSPSPSFPSPQWVTSDLNDARCGGSGGNPDQHTAARHPSPTWHASTAFRRERGVVHRRSRAPKAPREGVGRARPPPSPAADGVGRGLPPGGRWRRRAASPAERLQETRPGCGQVCVAVSYVRGPRRRAAPGRRREDLDKREDGGREGVRGGGTLRRCAGPSSSPGWIASTTQTRSASCWPQPVARRWASFSSADVGARRSPCRARSWPGRRLSTVLLSQALRDVGPLRGLRGMCPPRCGGPSTSGKLADYLLGVGPGIQALRDVGLDGGDQSDYTFLLLPEAEEMLRALPRIYLWPCNCRAMWGNCSRPAWCLSALRERSRPRLGAWTGAVLSRSCARPTPRAHAHRLHRTVGTAITASATAVPTAAFLSSPRNVWVQPTSGRCAATWPPWNPEACKRVSALSAKVSVRRAVDDQRSRQRAAPRRQGLSRGCGCALPAARKTRSRCKPLPATWEGSRLAGPALKGRRPADMLDRLRSTPRCPELRPCQSE